MLTSVAYRPGPVPATQQQSSPACPPHPIFTLYAKIPSGGGTGTAMPSFSKSSCVWWSAFGFLAISTSARPPIRRGVSPACDGSRARGRSEEHTSELQSRENLVCRLLLEQ